MAEMRHHRSPSLAFVAPLLLLCVLPPIHTRMSTISDLKSKISGVEDLLEEYRKQLQRDQTYRPSEVADSCVSDFSSARGSIIRARASIEQGATFLMAPDPVYTWRDCVHACCAQPHCTVAVVQEEARQAGDSLNCYLFNCTYRSQNVCSFAPQPGFASHSRPVNVTMGLGSPDSYGGPGSERRTGEADETPEVDEPPRCDAGQDVVIQLPTDWAVLDGRDSVDDHGISHYDWTLVKGDADITMKATHPGLLKVTGLQEGVYTFQMTVTDTSGQKTSDNVSVTVLAPKHQAEVCTGHCSNYQFKCDDGCCIDITFACDGKQHCPDRSDEDFCPNFDTGRKSVTHVEGLPSHQLPPTYVEGSEDGLVLQTGSMKHDDDSRVAQERSRVTPQPSRQQDLIGQAAPRVSQSQENDIPAPKQFPVKGGHLVPESAAILPLALGLIITALLLLMIACRLQLVRHKLKKARPLTTEESDYLINGMYL
ncbi:low-density lipoprotein receptor-related protein 11 isoform X2 [Festucalex cinctus]